MEKACEKAERHRHHFEHLVNSTGSFQNHHPTQTVLLRSTEQSTEKNMLRFASFLSLLFKSKFFETQCTILQQQKEDLHCVER